jgi:RNA polymerase sigma-70 factor (ECF subfamily)
MSTTDAALARRVLAGEEAAFEDFFDTYFPRLFRFALPRLGGNEDDAEEVVQRVLIHAIARLATFRGEATLLTWLCTMCRREIGEWRERAGRLQEVPLLDDKPQMAAAVEALSTVTSGDPEAMLRRRELSALVQLTLDHLPGRYGDVLEWRYIQGLSVSEIAGRLGLGYKAAESVLSRARGAFREAYSFAASEWSAAGAGGPGRGKS